MSNQLLYFRATSFGENLPVDELEKATTLSEDADLRLVLGTSLRVAPANRLPFLKAKESKKKVVIVNLQKTPYDSLADVRIFAKTDDFFKVLMKQLKLEIPEFHQDEKALIELLNKIVVDDDKFKVGNDTNSKKK